jgi:hypothetical protein
MEIVSQDVTLLLSRVTFSSRTQPQVATGISVRVFPVLEELPFVGIWLMQGDEQQSPAAL